MISRKITAGWTMLAALLCAPAVACAENSESGVFLRVGELHVGDGRVITEAGVLVRDGRIAAVGSNINAPDGVAVIELTEGSLTPGLIDANAAVEPTDLMVYRGPGPSASEIVHEIFCRKHGHAPKSGCCGSLCSRAYLHVDGQYCNECGFPKREATLAVGTRPSAVNVEQSSEVIPHTRIIDSVNLRSPDFERLVNGGVTTVFVAPDSAAVISSRGAVVKTAGPARERIVREADAIQAAMGTDPSWRGVRNRQPWAQQVSHFSRRPTTRMGVTWVFRKALHDAIRETKGLPVYGADTPEPAAREALQSLLRGETGLRIQARQQNDILTSIRLAEEFQLPFTLVEATEAHLCLNELQQAGVPVVYGPIFIDPQGWRARSTEVNRSRLHTFQALLGAGIPTALTAHELRDEEGLARQAMHALRSGVPVKDVIQAVTLTPARLLGLEEEIGSIEQGKRADLVLWSGRPFEADSRPVAVWIHGEKVVDQMG